MALYQPAPPAELDDPQRAGTDPSSARAPSPDGQGRSAPEASSHPGAPPPDGRAAEEAAAAAQLWKVPPRRRDLPAHRDRVFAQVDLVRSWMSPWRSVLKLAAEAEKHPGGRDAALRAVAATADTMPSPARAMRLLTGEQPDSALLVAGLHISHLTAALEVLDANWPSVRKSAGQVDVALAQDALRRALMHALYLAVLRDIYAARVGQRLCLRDSLDGWHLTEDEVQEVLDWVHFDAKHFDGRRIPFLTEANRRRGYRTADSTWQWTYTTTATLWAFAAGFGVMVGLFALLRAADVTGAWPQNWGAKMLVVFLFVALGAGAHVASLGLGRIRFDDKLRVYVGSGGATWLSLRWLAIAALFVPITAVSASLWGAGNVPASFQELGTALLAGYSADSLFRAALAKMADDRSDETTPQDAADTTPVTAPGATTAAPGAQGVVTPGSPSSAALTTG